MKLTSILGVFVGAGIGGVLRYAIGTWMTERTGSAFPWHTLAINVGGAFLLGVLMALASERGIVAPDVALFLGVGLLGGFTTFSTFSYESVVLLEQGLTAQAAANMFGSGALGLAAAFAGMLVGRAV
jgi:CrcB protein